MDDYTGRVIKSYEVRERIGEGGFGAVYRAHQQFIGREVAIKIILPQYANRPDFIRRFETEAQLVARLEHPHIVPLYDYWREPSGAYLVMRWLRGGSIHELLKREGVLSPAKVSRIFNEVAEALAVAHRQGVIHRDLKPENIMLDENGNAYLSDFGIAKDTGHKVNITQNNAIVGSPAYLSPEQIRGEEITPQSDIYTMGFVLYEMLTGKRPFEDPSPATLMYKHLSEPVPDITITNFDLPEEVNQIIQRATAKEPGLRFETILDFSTEFRRAVRAIEGYPPSPRSTQQYTAVMTSTTGLLMPEPENPYKGLRAFQQADASDFYGRQTLTEEILARLQEDDEKARFLAVVGPSGSGKSSVVKAGVLPKLREGVLADSENWFIVEMVPGIDPFEELEAALLRIAVNPPESLLNQLMEDERGLLRAIKRVLPDDDTELVLFIDQFEEIYTLYEEEDLRGQFMDSILAAVTDPRSRVRVIITLRADFYDRPLNYPRFGDLIRQRTEVVLPLSATELEEAIVRPAERVGMSLDNGLVAAIIGDVSEQPGTLPLLQYALTELFERRDGHTLTLDAYNEIGGTMGALARRADELYESLGEEGEAAARQLFLRLVTLGEGTEDTRRRALQSTLLSIGTDRDSMEMVIDAFGRYRLLTFDHDTETRSATVEVAHEALIRQWQLLRDWLDDSREDLRTQRRLSIAGEEWINAGHDPSFLARGARLEQFEAWFNDTDLELTDLEEAYLKASITAREERLAEERLRQEREEALERRSQNQLRILVAVMTTAAIAGFILAVFAFSQSQEAQNARQAAEDSALLAQENAAEANSLALAANARNALIESNPTLALSLALEANDAFSPAPVEIRRTLATVAYGPGPATRYTEHATAALDGVFSEDGTLSITAGGDGTLHIWDTTTGEQLRLIERPDTTFTDVVVQPGGNLIAASTHDGLIIFYDLDTGDEVSRITGHDDLVSSLVFTPDGTQLVSGSWDYTIRLWDVATSEEIRRYEGHNGVILDIALSENLQYIASSSADETIGDTEEDSEDRTVRIWEFESGLQLRELQPPDGFIRTVALSPDSRFVAAATWNSLDSGVITMWHIGSGREVQRFYGHTNIITEVEFSPDGQNLISGSWDRTLRFWKIDTGVELERFDNFDDRVLSVNLTDDGQFALVTSGDFGDNFIEPGLDESRDTSVWVIDLRSRSLIQEVGSHRDWIWSADISPDGRFAVTGSGPLRENVIETVGRIWNLETGEEIASLQGHTWTVEGVAFHPNGENVLTAAWDGLVILWDMEGNEIRRFGNAANEGGRSHESRLTSATFNPDGSLAATGADNGEIIIWDVQTGEEYLVLTGHEGNANGVAFSPDGTRLVSGSWDNTLRLWDVQTGEELAIFTGHTGWINDAAYMPDGNGVVSGSWDGSVRLWDIETGEEIHRFEGHNGPVQGVDVSDDGQFILSGAGDTTMRQWDVATGQEIFRFDGHGDWVSEVVFLPDGNALSSSQDNILRMWRIPGSTASIVEWATENRYIRELTCGERSRYRVEPLCEDEA